MFMISLRIFSITDNKKKEIIIIVQRYKGNIFWNDWSKIEESLQKIEEKLQFFYAIL